MRNASRFLAIILVSVALITVITLSDLSIKNVNSISISGESSGVYPYDNGIIVVASPNYFNNSVYFITPSGANEIASFSNSSTIVSTVVISNSTTAILDTLFTPTYASSLQKIINYTKTEVTVLQGEQILSSKSFNNFTIGLTSPNGIIYITYLPNDTSILSISGNATTFHGYIINAYLTEYGLLTIDSASPSITQTASGQGNEISNVNISLSGKWSMNVSGYQGSSIVNNLIVVSNSTSTFVINISNGKIIESISINGLILKGSTLIINDTLYQVVGEPADGTGANLIVVNLTTGKYSISQAIYSGYLLESVEYGSNYVFVSGINDNNGYLMMNVLNYSGQSIYQNITTSNLPLVQPYDAVYSGGYIYVLIGSQTESGILTNVKVIQIILPSTSVSTSTSPTTTTTTTTTSTTSTTSTPTTTTSTTTSTTTPPPTNTSTTTSTTTTSTSTTTTTTSSTTSSTSTTTSTTSTQIPVPPTLTTTTKSSSNLTLYIGIIAIIVIIVGLVVLLLRRR